MYVFEVVSWKKWKKKINGKIKLKRRHSRQKDIKINRLKNCNCQIDMWSKINKDQKTQIYSEEYFRNIKERRVLYIPPIPVWNHEPSPPPLLITNSLMRGEGVLYCTAYLVVTWCWQCTQVRSTGPSDRWVGTTSWVATGGGALCSGPMSKSFSCWVFPRNKIKINCVHAFISIMAQNWKLTDSRLLKHKKTTSQGFYLKLS